MRTRTARITTTTITSTTGTNTNTITGIIEAESASLLPLLVWLSPAFPVGAFAYSHGLEWAVECGDVRDPQTLAAWIDDLIEAGSIRTDAILTASAWRAAGAGLGAELDEINALALALAPSRERWLETLSTGNAFVLAIRTAWPSPTLDRLAERAAGSVAYPVALGAAAADHSIGLAGLLEASIVAFVANLASATVRLGPIGQSDAQRLIAGSLGRCRAVADFAARATLNDLGAATFRSDIASMRHETQYSRLFRS